MRTEIITTANGTKRLICHRENETYAEFKKLMLDAQNNFYKITIKN